MFKSDAKPGIVRPAKYSKTAYGAPTSIMNAPLAAHKPSVKKSEACVHFSGTKTFNNDTRNVRPVSTTSVMMAAYTACVNCSMPSNDFCIPVGKSTRSGMRQWKFMLLRVRCRPGARLRSSRAEPSAHPATVLCPLRV